MPAWPCRTGRPPTATPAAFIPGGPGSSAFDLFIEHGHRLLGALAGLVSIGLVAVSWPAIGAGKFAGERWSVAAGVGARAARRRRVLLDERTWP